MKTKGEKTKERILSAAISLFSRKGLDGTSVRAIARTVQMNEASLYNHFKGKEDLYNKVIQVFTDELLISGIEPPDIETIDLSAPLFELIRADALRFFKRAGTKQARQIWRILMTEQYRHKATAEFVKNGVLKRPEAHLSGLIRELQQREKVKEEVDPATAGRTLASMFFYFSFSANLQVCWQGDAGKEWKVLEENLRFFCKQIERNT
ncbi:MAG: TetR/AcrR family transcriptional regulator [Spirochaetia bacterium]